MTNIVLNILISTMAFIARLESVFFLVHLGSGQMKSEDRSDQCKRVTSEIHGLYDNLLQQIVEKDQEIKEAVEKIKLLSSDQVLTDSEFLDCLDVIEGGFNPFCIVQMAFISNYMLRQSGIDKTNPETVNQLRNCVESCVGSLMNFYYDWFDKYVSIIRLDLEATALIEHTSVVENAWEESLKTLSGLVKIVFGCYGRMQNKYYAAFKEFLGVESTYRFKNLRGLFKDTEN